MLNAIQHGVTIADLQIRRKEQQCGLRNIGDWGEGLNHVGEKLALVVLSLRRFLAVSGTKKWSAEIKVPAQNKIKLAGMNGQDPLLVRRISASFSHTTALSTRNESAKGPIISAFTGQLRHPLQGWGPMLSTCHHERDLHSQQRLAQDPLPPPLEPDGYGIYFSG